MKIYFVRHGETDWNVKKKIQGTTDIPLNENGLKQAKRLAERLLKRGLKVESVYTSPHKRASQTAEILADALDVSCYELEGLAEMDLGDWEGSNWERIEEEYGQIYHNWNEHRRYVKTPNGECYNEVLERTLKALQIILEKETEDVLVVTHSAVLMSLRCYLAKLEFEEMVDRFKTKNAELLEIDTEDIKEAISRFEQGE